MPMRRRVVKRKRVKVRRRKRTTRTRQTTTSRVSRAPSDRTIVKFSYVDLITGPALVQSVLNNPRIYQTSLFAPSLSTPSHQPLWYDQYCPNFYSVYRVFGIKWSVTATNRGINESWILGVRHQNSATAETSIQTLMERNDSKTVVAGSVNSGKAMVRLSGYMSLAKVRGVSKKDIATESIYEAGYTASPSTMGYLSLYTLHNAASTISSIDYVVRLTYYAELSGRVSPFGS